MSHADAAGANSSDELRQKILELRTDLNEIARLVKESARQKMHEATAAATQQCHSAGQQARECCGQVEDYVREKPLSSLFMAGGVGLLVGLIWGRK